jgi:hypothetical protein
MDKELLLYFDDKCLAAGIARLNERNKWELYAPTVEGMGRAQYNRPIQLKNNPENHCEYDDLIPYCTYSGVSYVGDKTGDLWGLIRLSAHEDPKTPEEHVGGEWELIVPIEYPNIYELEKIFMVKLYFDNKDLAAGVARLNARNKWEIYTPTVRDMENADYDNRVQLKNNPENHCEYDDLIPYCTYSGVSYIGVKIGDLWGLIRLSESKDPKTPKERVGGEWELIVPIESPNIAELKKIDTMNLYFDDKALAAGVARLNERNKWELYAPTVEGMGRAQYNRPIQLKNNPENHCEYDDLIPYCTYSGVSYVGVKTGDLWGLIRLSAHKDPKTPEEHVGGEWELIVPIEYQNIADLKKKMQMTIIGKINGIYANIDSMCKWEKTIRATQWKQGRSAWALADFILNGGGEATLTDIVVKILGKNVQFDKAIIEMAVRFDMFGTGRHHDLGIWGHTDDGKKVFVSVESKVDEPFGRTILEEYIDAKIAKLNGTNTNLDQRIEGLLQKLGTNTKISTETFDLRYQLLHSMFGTIEAKDDGGNNADYSVMIIVEFQTSLFNPQIGGKNHADFIKFINEVSGIRITPDDSNLEAYSLKINNKELDIVYLEG